MIYENLNALCKSNCITISALEKRCGLGHGTIQKWSKSKSDAKIRMSTIQTVAAYFHVSTDLILGRRK